MSRKIQPWDINAQYKFTEAIENENKIRRIWFQKYRQHLLDNIVTDRCQLIRSKLKKLKEEQTHWEIEEAKQNVSTKELLPKAQNKRDDFSTNYMRPVHPQVLSILYDKNKTSYEALKSYLRERYKTRPEDKFYIADCTNWNYGWRLKNFPPVNSSECSRSIIKEVHVQRNTSGIKPDLNMTRPPQATFKKL